MKNYAILTLPLLCLPAYADEAPEFEVTSACFTPPQEEATDSEPEPPLVISLAALINQRQWSYENSDWVEVDDNHDDIEEEYDIEEDEEMDYAQEPEADTFLTYDVKFDAKLVAQDGSELPAALTCSDVSKGILEATFTCSKTPPTVYMQYSLKGELSYRTASNEELTTTGQMQLRSGTECCVDDFRIEIIWNPEDAAWYITVTTDTPERYPLIHKIVLCTPNGEERRQSAYKEPDAKCLTVDLECEDEDITEGAYTPEPQNYSFYLELLTTDSEAHYRIDQPIRLNGK